MRLVIHVNAGEICEKERFQSVANCEIALETMAEYCTKYCAQEQLAVYRTKCEKHYQYQISNYAQKRCMRQKTQRDVHSGCEASV